MSQVNATNTIKFTPTTEGMVCAYTSIMVMAFLPIILGSFKSIKHQTETHAKCRETGEQAETMTTKDAVMFPFIASGALFGLYILIKLFPDAVNLLVSGYFDILGMVAIFRLVSPTLYTVVPKRFNSTQYTFLFGSKPIEDEISTAPASNNGGKESPESSSSSIESDTVPSNIMVCSKFTPSDVLAALVAGVLGLWYIITKHWIANNAFGLAFAFNGIELLPVNSVKIGCILLCGLFIYDVFWVFGTEVMVSVARKFDAPIKVVFPQDFLVNGIWGKHFAMLGLGDIVIPGIFIAFLLRFDHSLKRKQNVYFWSCFLAYVLGLGITIGIMSYFKHAQPALLYLVPTCILIPLTIAFIRGDFKTLLNYRDHPLPVEQDDESQSEDEEESEDDDHKDEAEPKKSIRTRANSKKNK